jgi:hypothetical protein
MVYDFHHKGTKPQRTQKDDLPIRKPRFYYKYTITNRRDAEFAETQIYLNIST